MYAQIQAEARKPGRAERNKDFLQICYYRNPPFKFSKMERGGRGRDCVDLCSTRQKKERELCYRGEKEKKQEVFI